MHLLAGGAPFGTYNVSQSGDAMTWAGIAREVFALRGRAREDVRSVTTAEYGAGRAMAPRPEHSTLSLAKLRATGYEPMEQVEALAEYVSRLGPGGPRTSTNDGRGARSASDEPRDPSTGVSRLGPSGPRTSTNGRN